MFTLTTFTPSEAEKITGVSAARQRDYRRHGFMPIGDGHTRYDAYALARLWAFSLLGAQGIGPMRASDVADAIAAGVVYHSLCTSDGADFARKVHREHSGYGGALVPRFFILFPDGSEHFDESVDEAIGHMSPDGVDAINEKIEARLHNGSFLPITPEVVGRADRDHRVPGAIVVLDLRHLGEMLTVIAGRPLVHPEAD